MKLEEMKMEELELLSYTDITYMLLKQEKKTMTTPELFKIICNLLDYTDSEYESKIGDYYTSLTTDKRFIMLKTGEWDLRDNHSIEIVMDEDDDEIEESDEIDEVEEETDDEIDEVDDLDDIDDLDDMEDLVIVSEDEMEEE